MVVVSVVKSSTTRVRFYVICQVVRRFHRLLFLSLLSDTISLVVFVFFDHVKYELLYRI